MRSETSMFVASIRETLSARADAATRRWFEAYLKGAIPYRGVKTPEVAKVVLEVGRAHRLDAMPYVRRIEIASALVEGEHAEDKFSGFLVLQALTARRMGVPAAPILDAVESYFARGLISDWSSNDWLCVRVVDPLAERDGTPVITRVASWVSAETLWQRRSAAVALRGVAKEASSHGAIAKVVGRLVREDERFIQTGVGWLLAELSRAHPDVAAALVEKHFNALSREVIDRHTKHLPEHASYRRRKRDVVRER